MRIATIFLVGLMFVMCCGKIAAQTAFDTAIDNNFFVNAGPPASLAPKTAGTMSAQLRQFHVDCTTTPGISNPVNSTWFTGSGVPLIRWITGIGALVDPTDPANSILIVTGANALGSIAGPASNGTSDVDDSAVYVLAGDGGSLGGAGGDAAAENTGTGTGIAEAYAGVGYGSADGGLAEADCDAGEAIAHGGICGSGTGGAADAIGFSKALAQGGSANGAGGTGGAAYAYCSDATAEAFGGQGTNTGSTGGDATAEAPNDMAIAYGGDGVVGGGTAIANADGNCIARGGSTTGATSTAADV